MTAIIRRFVQVAPFAKLAISAQLSYYFEVFKSIFHIHNKKVDLNYES
jgi:hypothetical protein